MRPGGATRFVGSRASCHAHRAESGDEKHNQCERDGATHQHWPVDAEPGIGLGASCEPDGEDWRRERGAHRAKDGTAGDHAGDRPERGDALQSRRTECRQDGLPATDDSKLSRHDDGDRHQAHDRRDTGEQPQREREQIHGVARAFRLDRQALRTDQRCSEDLARARDDVLHTGVTVTRAYADPCSEHADLVVIGLTERPRQDEQTTRSTAVAEIERTPLDPHDAQRHGRTLAWADVSPPRSGSRRSVRACTTRCRACRPDAARGASRGLRRS